MYIVSCLAKCKLCLTTIHPLHTWLASCEKCIWAFTQKEALIIHMRTYTSLFRLFLSLECVRHHGQKVFTSPEHRESFCPCCIFHFYRRPAAWVVTSDNEFLVRPLGFWQRQERTWTSPWTFALWGPCESWDPSSLSPASPVSHFQHQSCFIRLRSNKGLRRRPPPRLKHLASLKS